MFTTLGHSLCTSHSATLTHPPLPSPPDCHPPPNRTFSCGNYRCNFRVTVLLTVSLLNLELFYSVFSYCVFSYQTVVFEACLVFFFRLVSRGGSRIFVGSDANPWGWGCQHTNSSNFLKTCMNLRKFWAVREKGSPWIRQCLQSTNVIQLLFAFTNQQQAEYHVT